MYEWIHIISKFQPWKGNKKLIHLSYFKYENAFMVCLNSTICPRQVETTQQKNWFLLAHNSQLLNFSS